MATMGIEGVTRMIMTKKTYSWRIQDFKLHGKFNGEYISSPKFSAGNMKWGLRLYPKGYYRNYPSSEYVGLFLEILEIDDQSLVEVAIEFSILSLDGQSAKKKNVVHFFHFNSKLGGDGKYIGINSIWQYLIDENLTVFCRFRITSNLAHPLLPTSSTTLSSHYSDAQRFCEDFKKLSKNKGFIDMSDYEVIDDHKKVDENMRELSEDFRKLMESDRFCDVTLTAAGKRIQAHRAILSARSPVFSALFTYDTKENEEKVITIEDAEFDALQEMLRFIYSGKVEKLDQLAYELLILSDKYGLDGLKNLCEDSMSNNFTTDNVINILILSDLHSASFLKDKSLNFIKDHANTIVNTEEYKTLEKTNSPLIAEILRSIVKG